MSTKRAFEPEERTRLANGLRHHVLVWNERGAETFVLCHGFLDQAWSFQGLAQPLCEAGFRVVAFDWRGHGETEHVGAGGYYHFPDYVLDLHELMPSIASSPRIHLVGHSMGGTAAALYAASHPGQLATLSLVEGLGPPAFTGTPPDKLRAWLDSVDRLRAREARPLADMVDAVKRLRAQTPELPAELAYFLAEKGTTEAPGPAGGLAWRFDPLHRTTSPSGFSPEAFATFLAAIEAPTLVVSGSRGFRTSDHAARMKALPRASEIVLDDVGHMIHWMRPTELAAALVSHASAPR